MSWFVELRNDGRALFLPEHCAGISFNGELIIPKDLEAQAQAADTRYTPYKGMTSRIDDESILRELICTNMPLIIEADSNNNPLTLAAQLARFRRRVLEDSEDFSETFAVRLIPIAGSITRLALNPAAIAINYLDEYDDHIALGIGNGILHLEVYRQPLDMDTLPPLSRFNLGRSFERFQAKL
ncbi:MAG: hypothetical protein PHE48_04015 [Candidatus Daviesbacteria bacterium]|nr:hypothetical protein [Candidatus Daviesbacteria bacterium]